MRTYEIRVQHHSSTFSTFYVEHEKMPSRKEAIQFLENLLGDRSCYYDLDSVYVGTVNVILFKSWLE